MTGIHLTHLYCCRPGVTVCIITCPLIHFLPPCLFLSHPRLLLYSTLLSHPVSISTTLPCSSSLSLSIPPYLPRPQPACKSRSHAYWEVSRGRAALLLNMATNRIYRGCSLGVWCVPPSARVVTRMTACVSTLLDRNNTSTTLIRELQ